MQSHINTPLHSIFQMSSTALITVSSSQFIGAKSNQYYNFLLQIRLLNTEKILMQFWLICIEISLSLPFKIIPFPPCNRVFYVYITWKAS